MVKARKCNKGFNCGRSCISRTFNCFSNHDKNGKKIVENFTQYLVRLSGQKPFRKDPDDISLEGGDGFPPLRDKFTTHAEYISAGRELAMQFIKSELVQASEADRERREFINEKSRLRERILLEREGLKIKLEVALIEADRELADLVTLRLDEIKDEMKELDPETRTQFFDRTEELLNEKHALRLKFERGLIEKNDLVKRTLEIDQEMKDGRGESPSKRAFKKLREDYLLKNDNVTAEQVKESTEFVPLGLTESRYNLIRDSMVDVAKIVNMVPKKGFKVLKDPSKDRAYADHSLTIDDIREIGDNAKEQGATTQIEKMNISSKYYRESEKVKPSINTGKDYSRDDDTIYHEYGHHVEFANRDIAQAMTDWIKSRASGSPEKLNKLIPDGGYRDNEVAYPDEFIHKYVGKVYVGDGSLIPQTEAFSMGIEHFVNEWKMKRLFERDPEHFYLMLGVLKTLRDS